MNKNLQQGYGVVVAIIVAGLLVALAIFMTSNNGNEAPVNGGVNNQESQEEIQFRAPSEDDHVLGDPDAPISIVEFSDLECPFCARLHPTLGRIVEDNPDVKWIYRHFPLTTIHSKALVAAQASECVAKLGGNDAFWTFVDEAFRNPRNLNNAWYRERASSFGIEAEEFNTCLKDQDILAEIQRDLDEAVSTGGRGTPHVVVITQGGQLIPFSGALPYEQISRIIEEARIN